MKRILIKCVLMATVVCFLIPFSVNASTIKLYFPPEWASKSKQCTAIADTLSKSSGLEIQSVVAMTYPEIIAAFSKNQPTIVYVGSFLQAVLYARQLSIPIVQAIDGKEFYTSILIAPSSAGSDPASIIKSAGTSVAYAKGSSSGESGAKAATGGVAAVAVSNHYAAAIAVVTGSAKCAFVKDWWWKANQGTFKGLNQFHYPEVSDKKNPDNILSANKSVSPGELSKIKAAVIKNSNVFQVQHFKEFDAALLQPSFDLMKKGNIDPKTYAW